MKEHIFDIWTFQEVFNTLPEIALHELRFSSGKSRLKEIPRYVLEKEWSSLISNRNHPKKAWNNLRKQARVGALPFGRDSFLFTRCYLGVIKQKDFIDILRALLNVEEISSDRIRSFNPLYMLSFLSNPEGTCIYGIVGLKEKRPTESDETDGQEIEIHPVFVHPVWIYLSAIANNEKLPKLKEVYEYISLLRERFVQKFAELDEYLYKDWVLDTSFLIRYADFPFNPLLAFRNAVPSSEPVPIRIHVSEGIIQELEGLKKGSSKKADKAKLALNFLNEFKAAYPSEVIFHKIKDTDESYINYFVKRYAFSKTDAHVLTIAEALKRDGKDPLILTTDFSLLGAALDKRLPCVNRYPPAKLYFATKSLCELTNEIISDIYDWFIEFAKLNKIKPYTNEVAEKLLCDPQIETKHEFPKIINEELETNLPSFFIEAILETKELYLKSKTPQLLNCYLLGNSDQKNLREVMEDLLSPDCLPKASWPSKEGIHPFFNQYLAISAVNHHLIEGKEKRIISVNGPPGTGKTTLLKEIIANIVADMASAIVEESFRVSKREIRTEAFSRTYYSGFEIFTELGAIVASSNNNAVENVTKELPIDQDGIFTEENLSVKEILIQDPDTKKLWERFKDITKKCLKAVSAGDDQRNTDIYLSKCAINIAAVLGRQHLTRTFLKTLIAEIESLHKCKSKGSSFYELGNIAKNKITSISREFRKYISEWEVIKNELVFINSFESEKEKLVKSITKIKEDISKADDDLKKIITKIDQIATKNKELDQILKNKEKLLHFLMADLEAINDKLQILESNWKVKLYNFCRFFSFFAKAEIEQLESLKEKRCQLEKQKNLLYTEIKHLKDQIQSLNLQKTILERQIDRICSTVKKLNSKLDDHKKELSSLESDFYKLWSTYHNSDLVVVSRMLDVHDSIHGGLRQKLRPYGLEQVKRIREKIFFCAYKLLMWTAFEHIGAIKANLKLLYQLYISGSKKHLTEDERKQIARAAKSLWGSLFLLFPVVSTTFHSFQTLFFTLWEVRLDSPLGTILIDEAGQGLPYMALVPLMMARRAVVVGDPLQLEPVVTIPEEIFSALLKKYNIDNKDCFYISGLNQAFSGINLDSSVQILADKASIYSGSIPLPEEELKVGIPLRIHFRCAKKIMEIANEVAYGGFMIHFQEDPPPGRVQWIDVKTSKFKWQNKNFSPIELEVAYDLLIKLLNKWSSHEIYIISPFKAVENGFIKDSRIQKLLGVNTSKNIGTVHTFQGKEAPVVIFVLGGGSPGARDWAAKSPNLVNVAVTRAKKELYVIGDLADWKQRPYFEVLARFCAESSLDP